MTRSDALRALSGSMLSAVLPSLSVPARQPAPGKLAREHVSDAREKQLLEAAAGGDRRAAEALLRELLPRVRNLVRYFVRGDAEVDDLAQESLLNILRGAGGYRGEGQVRSWADRIVVRTVFAHLRRVRVAEARHVEYTPDLAPVSDGGPSFLARRKAVRALDEVPDDQRAVLVMHHVLGLSVKEIADETATPFETVRSRLRLGMARLRSALGDDDDTEPGARASSAREPASPRTSSAGELDTRSIPARGPDGALASSSREPERPRDSSRSELDEARGSSGRGSNKVGSR